MAGLGEVCSHVAAVLFTLEAVKIANGTTCTSLPCRWTQGSTKPVEYTAGANIDFISPARRKEHRNAPPYGQRYCPYISPASIVEENKLFLELSKSYPECAVL